MSVRPIPRVRGLRCLLLTRRTIEPQPNVMSTRGPCLPAWLGPAAEELAEAPAGGDEDDAVLRAQQVTRVGVPHQPRRALLAVGGRGGRQIAGPVVGVGQVEGEDPPGTGT